MNKVKAFRDNLIVKVLGKKSMLQPDFTLGVVQSVGSGVSDIQEGDLVTVDTNSFSRIINVDGEAYHIYKMLAVSAYVSKQDIDKVNISLKKKKVQ